MITNTIKETFQVIRRKSKITIIVIASFNFCEVVIAKFDFLLALLRLFNINSLCSSSPVFFFFFSFFLRNNLLSLLVERMLLGSIS